ncbi:MAG: hypothetical protein V1766_10870 [Pseudomonadota bacterium]
MLSSLSMFHPVRHGKKLNGETLRENEAAMDHGLPRTIRWVARFTNHIQYDGNNCSTTRCQYDIKRVDCNRDCNSDKNEPKEGDNDSDDSCAT